MSRLRLSSPCGRRLFFRVFGNHLASQPVRMTSFFTTTTICNSSSGIENQHTKAGKTAPRIPAPTWSIASLELEKQHAPVNRTVLEALARRALVDLHQLDNVEELQQEVGNMMHMMNQVQEFAGGSQSPAGSDKEAVDAEAKTQQMYDLPRNVNAAPLRRIREGDSEKGDEMECNQSVWDSLLAPKTQRVGGHAYFVIPTQRK